ncbi:galactose-specific lectin nattectin-like protein [Leptotrombidium deliense]|uniref:Galactose-specific lectin nattectin-like protein n=1 Tax=Leptotrombidium deliense TaxID=299467 RepID=A0A443S4U3_9ACAR|nr:galactose-specific lectin nattectin-like protein [Leptotrombidium deliense]
MLNTILILIATLFTLWLKCTSCINCPKNWFRYDNKCFFVNKTKASFKDTVINCNSLGATLVSIHSSKENQFIRHITEESKIYWTGGLQMSGFQNDFTWIDTSQFDFTHWFPRQPKTENFYKTYCYGITFLNGYWHATNCGFLSRQICQKQGNSKSGVLTNVGVFSNYVELKKIQISLAQLIKYFNSQRQNFQINKQQPARGRYQQHADKGISVIEKNMHFFNEILKNITLMNISIKRLQFKQRIVAEYAREVNDKLLRTQVSLVATQNELKRKAGSIFTFTVLGFVFIVWFALSIFIFLVYKKFMYLQYYVKNRDPLKRRTPLSTIDMKK